MKELQEMTVSDWLEAKLNMNATAFRRLINTAKLGHISIPSVVVPGQSPRITFVSESDIELFNRAKDAASMEKFNKDVKSWGLKVESELKSAATTRFGHRIEEYVNELFPHLADSIQLNLKFNKQYKLETKSVGFNIARHGVYLHKGAGRGYGGLDGSKWTDKYKRTKTTNPTSLGKQGTGERQSVHWFNDIINKNLPELADILANYSLDIAINTDSIFLPE